jgi:large subunit ribosomal protein L23
MNFQGKKKTRGTRTGWIEGRKPSYKKAVVFLKEGYSIDFYSNI